MDLSAYLFQRQMTQAAFAKQMGVSQGLVYQWLTGRRPVAVDRCVAIERSTGGAVGRRDLRPDDWQDIWPELADLSNRADASDDVQPPAGVPDRKEGE
ncbi:transcriptional regulator [Burkholderia vietnamiensis]|uniref:transcriptional regulator n=1 Tax=Burkholderia vietnamiensis TaxID=60552 RepID=UPI001D13D1E6|nr:YdaS family helix-turn-helix protein [Burkholderia vietnamiensis]UEC03942.1 helix-turn-helix domain-containing protein [Burkholderia vietnamiensis]